MIPRLHAVTDDRVLTDADFLRKAGAVLEAGRSGLALHVRGPGLSGARIFVTARELRDPATAAGALLLVNDRVDVALTLGLRGAHLGRRSLPPGESRRILGRSCILGVSAHGEEEAREAEADGADYVMAGTIFPSASHPGRASLGVAELSRMVEACPIPVVAIGGVGSGRVRDVLAGGAYGVAAVSGIWRAPDPAEAVLAYLEELEAA